LKDVAVADDCGDNMMAIFGYSQQTAVALCLFRRAAEDIGNRRNDAATTMGEAAAAVAVADNHTDDDRAVAVRGVEDRAPVCGNSVGVANVVRRYLGNNDHLHGHGGWGYNGAADAAAC
jgi:hypothetical protein